MHLKNETILGGGKYKIISVIGQGGFGITYLAEHVFLGTKVAIKEFFPKEFCNRDEATNRLTLGTQSNKETMEQLKERFLKEARNIARLDHPGIVKVKDIFQENETAYIVMDYIDGRDLNEIVKHRGYLDENRAKYYIKKVGNALNYIHDCRMAHLDVKPANIIIDNNDNPVLIDFGLSKQYDSQGDATSTMLHGVSPGYSAPELYTKGAVETFSPESDVYSLAATLYYLLTGIRPPESIEVRDNPGALSFPPGVSRDLCNALISIMTSLRGLRPDSIFQFNKLIGNPGGGIWNPQPPGPHPVPDPGPRPDPPKSNNLFWIIIGGFIAGMLILTVILIAVKNNSKPKYTGSGNLKTVKTEQVESNDRAAESPAKPSKSSSEASGAFKYIVDGPVVETKGKTCYYLSGSFYNDSGSWPVKLVVIDNGNGNFSAYYKNVTYKTKLKMSVSSSGSDRLVFRGKDGFVIDVYHSGSGWQGTAETKSNYLEVTLQPTTETFSW